jgi:hypothetical protein
MWSAIARIRSPKQRTGAGCARQIDSTKSHHAPIFVVTGNFIVVLTQLRTMLL